jgi:dTDP-4-dehydrorhamnose 3,5-epimerase-like enzyme
MEINNNGIQIIPIPKIEERRGNLSVIENDTIPFDIKRVYYLYDVPSGAERGGHAHKNLKQFLIALSGSFDVVLKDGKKEQIVTLNKPYEGLLIHQGIWRELQNFSSGSVCLVVASEVYIEDDYIRDFEEFMSYTIDK